MRTPTSRGSNRTVVFWSIADVWSGADSAPLAILIATIPEPDLPRGGYSAASAAMNERHRYVESGASGLPVDDPLQLVNLIELPDRFGAAAEIRFHRHPGHGVEPHALFGDPGYCYRDVSPISCFVGRLGLSLHQSRIGVAVRAELADQHVGLFLNPPCPLASSAQPGQDLLAHFHSGPSLHELALLATGTA